MHYLLQRLNERDAKIKDLQKKVEELEEDVVDLEEEVDNLEETVEEFEEEVRGLEEEVDDSEEEIKSLVKEGDKLEEILCEKDLEISLLKGEIQKNKSAPEMLYGVKIINLEDEIKEKAISVDKLWVIVRENNKALLAARDFIKDLGEQLREADIIIDVRTSKINDLEIELEESRKENSILEHQGKILQKDSVLLQQKQNILWKKIGLLETLIRLR